MELIVNLIVQLVAGGVGGNVLARIAKNLDLGTTGNTIAGAVGGLGGTWLASLIPGLSGLVGDLGGAGGLNAGALVGQGVTGVIGGAILTAIAALIKNATAK